MRVVAPDKRGGCFAGARGRYKKMRGDAACAHGFHLGHALRGRGQRVFRANSNDVLKRLAPAARPCLAACMNRRRIDVHHHMLPPKYVAWLNENGVHDAGGRKLPEWAVEPTLALMDRHEIQTAILSISTPGVYPAPPPAGIGKNPLARSWAREVNEFAAQLAKDHPSRFGFFATLTLPDLDGAIEEACYALDTLGASGIILLANAHGEYLGDPQHEPLFAELNRRNAVVFVHPAALPGPSVEGIPPFAADFLLDTTRAAYRLVRNGFVQRHAGIRIILSHAGGFMPYASHRMGLAITVETQRPFPEVLNDFRSFYLDTALSGSPAALPSLLAFAKPGHVLYGSDWPFAPEMAISVFNRQLDGYSELDAAGHAAIDRSNAEALFPKLTGVG